MKCLCVLLCAAAAFGAELKLGKPLALKTTTPIEQLSASPDGFVGKTVQVKGKVTEVCQMMGCWMAIADNGKAIRIKVNDGEIEFPKDSVGKNVTAEGKFMKIDLTKEQAIARAQHEAEEAGRKFDPESIKTGSTIYQIQGSGAVIVD